MKPKTGEGGQALVSQQFRWCDFNTSRRERWARESGHSSTRYRRQWQWHGTGYEAVAQQHSVRERRQHGSSSEAVANDACDAVTMYQLQVIRRGLSAFQHKNLAGTPDYREAARATR